MMTRLIPLVTLALSACSAVWLPARSIENEVEHVPGVFVRSDTLQDILRAGTPLTERLQPEDFLRVVVPIRNIDIEPVQIVVQVQFLDAHGRTIPGEQQHDVMVLSALGTGNFQAISRGSRAAGFELQLMWDK